MAKLVATEPQDLLLSPHTGMKGRHNGCLLRAWSRLRALHRRHRRSGTGVQRWRVTNLIPRKLVIGATAGTVLLGAQYLEHAPDLGIAVFAPLAVRNAHHGVPSTLEDRLSLDVLKLQLPVLVVGIELTIALDRDVGLGVSAAVTTRPRCRGKCGRWSSRALRLGPRRLTTWRPRREPAR